MDKNDITSRLAGRMGSSFREAEAWLEAVLDTLRGAYAMESAPGRDTTAGADDGSAGANAEPVLILRSVTPTARLSIGDEIILDRFPFRVGREARKRSAPSGMRLLKERREVNPVAITNELYVRDVGKPVNVSREHFQIEAKEDGSFELVDRGSACGTIVSDHIVGGNYTGGRCPLKVGDSIIVGTRDSAIVFEFCQAGA